MSILDGDPNFYDVVRLLRKMEPRAQHQALYASLYWSDDKLDESEAKGDLPGQPRALTTARADFN
jgi:hypothetical protein